MISAGSRPSRSQWPSSTPTRWRRRSASPKKLEASAYCATIRSVFFSPLPPIMIGMSPRIGLGLFITSATRWWVPSTVEPSCVNIARMIWRESSRRSKRSEIGGKSNP